MKGNQPAILRAVYIILVPVVLLIILLNSGWLQRLLPAAEVNGENYSVVRYNYYYFDVYNTFLEENEDNLAELGYDSSASDAEQYTSEGITWREYFQQLGEAAMAETAYYCDLAEAAGYSFSEEELAPVQEKLDANAAVQLQYSLSAKNYYIAYYGSGMTEELYTEELTRQVQAQAYKSYLEETQEIDESAIEAWVQENYSWSYQAVNLKVITLDALADRSTGEIGDTQLQALSDKLARLVARYEAGESFETLQAAFSTCQLGGTDGAMESATEQQLPDAIAQWCLHDQSELSSGETFSCVDEESGIAYFVYLDSFSEDGAAVEAKAALSSEAVAEQEAQALAESYSVTRNKIGMTLATA